MLAIITIIDFFFFLLTLSAWKNNQDSVQILPPC